MVTRNCNLELAQSTRVKQIRDFADQEDRDRLLYILETSLEVLKPSQFFAWTQGPLQGLLPHEIVICGMAEGLSVTSRAIIRPSMEQLGVGFEPFLHGLKRGFTAQRGLRQLDS